MAEASAQVAEEIAQVTEASAQLAEAIARLTEACSRVAEVFARLADVIVYTKWLSVKRKYVPADPHNALVRPYNIPVRACDVLVDSCNVPARACNSVVEACDVLVIIGNVKLNSARTGIKVVYAPKQRLGTRVSMDRPIKLGIQRFAYELTLDYLNNAWISSTFCSTSFHSNECVDYRFVAEIHTSFRTHIDYLNVGIEMGQDFLSCELYPSRSAGIAEEFCSFIPS